jgi:hypothetical protein
MLNLISSQTLIFNFNAFFCVLYIEMDIKNKA